MVFNNKLFDYLTDDEDCDFEFKVLEKLFKRLEKLWLTNTMGFGSV